MKNQILTKKRPITLDNSTTPINYHIETSTLLVSNEDQIVNTITADISKTFIQKDSFGTLFSLEVKNRKQSNLDGNASLENELAWLQQELILYCNDKGEIINIVNREHIKEEWFSRKKEIKKSHKYIIDDIDIILQGTESLLEDELAFIELINASEIGTILFPPIYDQKLSTKKPLHQQKVFPLFFDDYELPLSIKTTLIDNKEAIHNQIIRSGSINTVRFKSSEVKRFFRKLYNAQDLRIDLDVAYLETYDLDVYNNVYASSQTMGVEINDLYRYRKISKLKKIANV